MPSYTFTPVDELNLQSWKRVYVNGVDMLEAWITRAYGADLAKFYRVKMPKCGKAVRLNDANGLSLHMSEAGIFLQTRSI